MAGEEPEAAFARFFTPGVRAHPAAPRPCAGPWTRRRCGASAREADRLKQAVAWLETDDAELRERITAEKVEAEFARGSFSWLLLRRLLEAGETEALEQAYELIREVRG